MCVDSLICTMDRFSMLGQDLVTRSTNMGGVCVITPTAKKKKNHKVFNNKKFNTLHQFVCCCENCCIFWHIVCRMREDVELPQMVAYRILPTSFMVGVAALV